MPLHAAPIQIPKQQQPSKISISMGMQQYAFEEERQMQRAQKVNQTTTSIKLSSSLST